MKDIKGYEGLYAVTENGQVWSYRSQIFLKQMANKDGYLRVGLNKDGIKKQFMVHRLVGEAYIPNIEGLPQIGQEIIIVYLISIGLQQKKIVIMDSIERENLKLIAYQLFVQSLIKSLKVL